VIGTTQPENLPRDEETFAAKCGHSIARERKRRVTQSDDGHQCALVCDYVIPVAMDAARFAGFRPAQPMLAARLTPCLKMHQEGRLFVAGEAMSFAAKT